jgi:hypothetical protein
MLSSGMLRRVALVRPDVSEERWFLQKPHSVTFQKTSFFIVIAMKNSNLTLCRMVLYILRSKICTVAKIKI